MEKERNTSRPMKRGRKKVCMFCADRAEKIDYKDIAKLRKCMTERAKILQTCNWHLCLSSERTYNSYQESTSCGTSSICS